MVVFPAAFANQSWEISIFVDILANLGPQAVERSESIYFDFIKINFIPSRIQARPSHLLKVGPIRHANWAPLGSIEKTRNFVMRFGHVTILAIFNFPKYTKYAIQKNKLCGRFGHNFPRLAYNACKLWNIWYIRDRTSEIEASKVRACRDSVTEHRPISRQEIDNAIGNSRFLTNLINQIIGQQGSV